MEQTSFKKIAQPVGIFFRTEFSSTFLTFYQQFKNYTTALPAVLFFSIEFAYARAGTPASMPPTFKIKHL